jgi:hypothetical protein
MAQPGRRPSRFVLFEPLDPTWWIAQGGRTWRWIVGFVLTMGLLLSAPAISDALDSRGLPGGPIALGAVGVMVALTLWAYSTTIPRSRRRRAMRRWAREREAPFRSDFVLPSSLKEVPSLEGLGLEGGVANLAVVRVVEDEVMVFDRWRASAAGYEDAECRTVAAVHARMDLPRVVIHPRHHPFRGAVSQDELQPVGTESGEFDRRFRVITDDRAGAVAVIDARAMAWLLDRPVDLTYETAGQWLTCSRSSGSADQIDALVGSVVGFRDHLPRVSASFYPPEDPGLGRGRSH